MNTFRLRIYATEHPIFEGECESVIVPTTRGPYGVLAHHIDMVAAICDGELKYREKGKAEYECVAIAPGILSIRKNEVTVLAETAERAAEIDVGRAQKQLLHARERLEKSSSELSRHLAQTKISRALTRIKVGSGIHK